MIVPFLACGDLSGFDSDKTYPLKVYSFFVTDRHTCIHVQIHQSIIHTYRQTYRQTDSSSHPFSKPAFISKSIHFHGWLLSFTMYKSETYGERCFMCEDPFLPTNFHFVNLCSYECVSMKKLYLFTETSKLTWDRNIWIVLEIYNLHLTILWINKIPRKLEERTCE